MLQSALRLDFGTWDVKAETPPQTVLAAMTRLKARLADQETAAAPEWPEAVQVQMEAMLHDQADLLDETQKMMAAWSKRRQEAMEAGFRTLEKVSKSRDASDMAAAYGEWLSSSMGRIMADMMAAQAGALRLAALSQTAMKALAPTGPLAPPPRGKPPIPG